MSAPADQPAIQCFLSYARDDEAELTFIDEFKSALNHFAYSDRGRRVEVFVDHDSIGWGEEWRQRIRDSVSAATVFIPLITFQYLSRPMCREELMLFVEGAQKLGATELFLPVMVLGHRFISEDSDDPVAQRIAQRQAKDLRNAVLQGTQSATWRETMLDIANSLVDAVESAEEHLTRREASGQHPILEPDEPDEPDEIDEDAPGLHELDEAAADGLDEIRVLMENMMGLFEKVVAIVDYAMVELNTATDQHRKTAILFRFANDIKPLSEQIQTTGSRLEVRTTEIDGLLRNAWTLARDHGGTQTVESFRSSIATGVAALSDLDNAAESISEFLESLKPAEVMSVALRKAIRPMRKGVTSVLSAFLTMQSWRSITDN